VPLGRALRKARADGSLVVPYVLVDRRRTDRLASLAHALRDGGANALELGFPFSDPIADGPVLEAASGRSIAAGTTWKDLLESVRRTSPVLPTAVMTYANPVWNRGLARALSDLSGAGAVGLIVPDLPLEESEPWRRAARAAEVDLVLLAAPGVELDRVRRIAQHSRGFLYLVSRYGTTGAGGLQGVEELSSIVRAAHAANSALPVLVGFGVRDRSSADAARSTGADGVIVGTALEEKIAGGTSHVSITQWLRSVAGPRLEATSGP
jgi:tryptophan synthase alpha chain